MEFIDHSEAKDKLAQLEAEDAPVERMPLNRIINVAKDQGGSLTQVEENKGKVNSIVERINKMSKQATPKDEESVEENAGAENAQEDGQEGEEEQNEVGELPLGELSESLVSVLEGREFKTVDDIKAGITDVVQMLQDEVKANERLIDIFEQNPDFQKVAQLMGTRNLSFSEALLHVGIKSVDDVAPDPVDDPEGYKKFMKEKAKAELEAENFNKQLESNKEVTKNNLIAFKQEKKLDDVAYKKVISQMDEIVQEIRTGRISKQLLDTLYKASNYENDVKKAEEAGEKKGKVQQIQAKRNEKQVPLPTIRQKGDNVGDQNKPQPSRSKRALANLASMPSRFSQIK